MTLVILPIGLVDGGRADEADILEGRLREAISMGDHSRIVELATKRLEIDPAPSTLWYWRARAQFCLGHIPESVRDFDRYYESEPNQRSRQWERGIALYYGGRHEDGANQFELYQTYHDNDVENSVWRFLCLVPVVGFEKARETILPIRRDPRVPMMPIYDLYRGAGTVEQVWEAVEAGDPSPEVLAGRRFYAQLYVGLFHEARGEPELARKYILPAADDHGQTEGINRYMWEVARVHAERVRQAEVNEKAKDKEGQQVKQEQTDDR
jgi:lipoprotein NlpI